MYLTQVKHYYCRVECELIGISIVVQVAAFLALVAVARAGVVGPAGLAYAQPAYAAAPVAYAQPVAKGK